MSARAAEVALGLGAPLTEIPTAATSAGGSDTSPESSVSKHSMAQGAMDDNGVLRRDTFVDKAENEKLDYQDSGASPRRRWTYGNSKGRNRSLRVFPTMSSFGNGFGDSDTGSGRPWKWKRSRTIDTENAETSGDETDGGFGVIKRHDSSTHPDDIAAKVKVKHRYLPILSGLACPFGVLLDIPGLTEKWYVRTYGYEIVDSQPNPTILEVGLAVSMTLGLIANIALISRFLERRPYHATLVAIFALTIHDIINVVVLVTFGVVHRIDDGFTYGDAYWMTIASTVASLTCNVTLIIDLVRTSNFRLHGSGLTEKQRTLVIACMALLCYIGLGSLVFSLLLSPKLAYIDSLYFTICTITSVGFGDIYPDTLSSKLFSFLYDTAGLALLAITIAVARETVIETFEASYRKRREVLAAKAKERKEEKRKRDKLRRERRQRELKEAAERALNGHKEDKPSVENVAEKQPIVTGGGRGGAAKAAAARAKREYEYLDEKEQGISSGKALINRILRKWGLMAPYKPPKKEPEDLGLGLERTLTSSSLSAEEGYKSFKKQLQKEQTSEFRLKLGVALALFFSFWLVGAAVFHLTEKWSYFEAMYFCFVFFSTIGYGDYSPKSSSGRAFFIAWSMFGIAAMTLLLSVVTETWSSRYKSSIAEGKVKRRIRKIRVGMADTGQKVEDNNREHALQLLALEGFHGNEESLEPAELPKRLTEAVKGFHEHARFFMHGRTGDTPEALRVLIDAADDLDDEFEKLQEDGELEGGASSETRHFLFMLSYERALDGLIDAAEQLTDVFRTHSAELDEMKNLNEQLRDSLQNDNEIDDANDEDETLPPGENDDDVSLGGADRQLGFKDLMPFHSTRPAGGDSDDEVDEELCRELDGPDDDAIPNRPTSIRVRLAGATPPNEASSSSPHHSRAPSIRSLNPSVNGSVRNRAASLSAGAALRRSSSYLYNMSTHSQERIDLTKARPPGSVNNVSSMSLFSHPASSGVTDEATASDPIDVRTAASATSYSPRSPTSALTFAEPASPRPRSASSSSKGVMGIANRLRHHKEKDG